MRPVAPPTHLHIQNQAKMPLLDLPNELFLTIANFLEPLARYRKPCDIYHLTLTNRRFANLLIPKLTALACHNQDMSKEALYRAAAFHNEPNVRLLLNKGKFLEVRQRRTDTWETVWNTRPKQRTAEICPDDVVAFVVEQGADLVLDWIGVEHCALHWGVSRGDASLARDVLRCGAAVEFRYVADWPVEIWGPLALLPPSIPFSWDSGPLHKAAYLGGLEMVRLLVENGVGVNVQDQLGRTALDAGIDGGHEGVVRYLLECGADINLPNRRGQTAFHEALKTGDDVMVRLLIGKGADIHAVERKGRTALHLAAENEHEVMMLLLLKEGLDVGVRDKDGNTALHVAAERGQVGCVRRLLAFGADAKGVNGCAKTPLELVMTVGFEHEHEEELVKLLDEGVERGWCVC